MDKELISIAILILFSAINVDAQNGNRATVTELHEPVPPVVTPGIGTSPPSDAIILFDGANLDKWEGINGTPAPWIVENGYVTVLPRSGDIWTKQEFGDIQVHLEWRVSSDGQGAGNSGVFFMGKYEVQIYNSFEKYIYPNGQAASIYKQSIPLVNACRNPGEWETYDIIFMAPRFNQMGRVTHPARVTVFHNGVVVQNNVEIWGEARHIGLPTYNKHPDRLPLRLQNHGDRVSFRNIWAREL